MKLSEALQNLEIQQTVNLCKFGSIFQSLSVEDQKALTQVMDNKNVASSSISKVLSENGLQISSERVRYHRAKACQCP